MVTPIVACAIGLLLGSCGSSTPEMISVSYVCASPPADLAGCSVDTDCMTVAIGCYCGAQPVNGVARKYAPTARNCEDAAASSCALGCATQPKLVAQDGAMVDPGTLLGAHCDHSGASAVCKSYLPPAGGGSGDPGSGGW
ncbi:MAG: hypothetical protein E6J90_34835 [Deltaproteobacteria bacterium]|nr:MAG: hypothetical protein E6J90_34835 [Deltaproteobacteria bacterium]